MQCERKNKLSYLILSYLLRRFRIVRCNRQAALHSAMNNYTPLVIGGAGKNKQKIIGASKKFKNQPRLLVRPSYVTFCQNF
jgi:hypothetical protein